MSQPEAETRGKLAIALAIGDPAGIGPELVARLLADPELRENRVLLIADGDEVEEGMRIAGARFDYVLTNDPERADFSAGRPVLFDFRGDASKPFARAEATANGGRYSLDTLRQCLDLTTAGVTDAACFGPLNKSSLHLAGMRHADESHWFADVLGVATDRMSGELNVLDGLWTSRVTSHVALRQVPDLLSRERVADAAELVWRTLRQAGIAEPRIAVCGLNPHNGDNGAFGREEIDVIAPGVALACARGIPATGPYPADTIFLKARAGELDAIVTMYHDQGQIAMKLMGFDRGVTVHGGLPIPITTPAHGTAFDIQGRGRANVGAMRRAFELACAMARSRRAASASRGSGR